MADFPLLMSCASFVLLMIAVWIGNLLRKRTAAEANRDDAGVVLAGTLTLLGLIIGFSLAMAINRYDLRKSSEQTEVNAIDVLHTRSDLLPPPDAAKAHELLQRYINQRIAFYTTRDRDEIRRISADTAQTQNQLWSTIEAALRPLPPQLQGLFITGYNDVEVSWRTTQAVWSNRIPVAVWILILVASILCNLLVGYRARQTDWLVFLVMPVAVSISLFLISDLDSPRGGAIRVRPNNLISLSQSIGSQSH
jgi:hypothetical protein